MYSINYYAPYTNSWRRQYFNSIDAALSMIDFYQSCGTKAYLR